MAAQQNRILSALGSSLRISDDGTLDDVLNGGQNPRLYFSTYNLDHPLLSGIEYDPVNPNDKLYTERFSQYGGASPDKSAALEWFDLDRLPDGLRPRHDLLQGSGQ